MPSDQMTFVQHLEELRRRILWALAAWAVCAGLALQGVDLWLPWLLRPVGHVVFVSPAEALMSRLLLACVVGVLAVLPYWLWQVWGFMAPALTPGQRREVGRMLPSALALCYTGAAVALCVALPMTVRFLLGFATESVRPMITFGHYISFVAMWTLLFGAVFELPLVLLVLGRLGVVNSRLLRKFRRHVIVGILCVAAILTPPDVLSQLLLGMPLIVLYELSVWLLRLVEKKP